MEEFVVKCFGVSVIKKRFEVMNNSIFRKQVVRGLEITFEKRLLIHIYKDRWFWREKTGSLSNSRFNIVVNIDECFLIESVPNCQLTPSVLVSWGFRSSITSVVL